MRKAVLVVGALVMAMVLSSCFVLQGFTVLATSIAPGQRTKAQFTLHPYSTNPNRQFEFVLVGVNSTDDDLTVGNATWGTNGTFGGPKAMVFYGTLDDTLVLEGSCSSSGLDFGSITDVNWKGFVTQTKVRDRGKVNTKAIVQVVVRARNTAAAGNEPVIGVAGTFIDDGDGVPDTGDTFYCTGISTANVYVT